MESRPISEKVLLAGAGSRGVVLITLLLLLPAASASAAEVWSWRTDDGAYAFADDVKKIPARYRDRAQKSESRKITDYERFTPKDSAAAASYAAHLERRLKHLRELNEELDEGGPGAAPSYADQAVSLRLGGENAPELDLSTGPSNEPVIIQEQRVRGRGQIATRHDTVITQGKRTLVVVKGRQRGEVNASTSIRDEDEQPY